MTAIVDGLPTLPFEVRQHGKLNSWRLHSVLKSTVESLPAAQVRLACAHNGFDLNMIQMEVEGRTVHRQGDSGETD